MAKNKDNQPDDTNEPDVTDIPAPPDPWAVLDKIGTALSVLSSRSDSGGGGRTDELMIRLTETMARLSEANIEGSKLIAAETRRAHRPSNEIAPGISVFNRRGTNLPANAEGVRKPPLKCIVLAPWLVEWESCTREEVELLNLLQAGEYQLKRTDGSKIRVTVQMDYRVDGKTPSRMVINHDTAFNNDNFRLVPAFAEMIRQLLKQHEDQDIRKFAASVLSDEEEEALIEAGELSVSS